MKSWESKEHTIVSINNAPKTQIVIFSTITGSFILPETHIAVKYTFS